MTQRGLRGCESNTNSLCSFCLRAADGLCTTVLPLELSQTQYRMKRSATSNDEELNTTTRHSQHRKADHTKSSREADQPEAAVDEADFKQSAPTGMFRRNPKEKTPTFTSFVIPTSEEEKTDDVALKQAQSNKQGGLKGVMKGLQFKSSPK
ncbi:uncharacterized protein PAE49_016129 isoform 2-T2 [Odontesthes bonariensis]